MEKGKHDLENNSNKKTYIYKSKYILIFIILVIMALLIKDIYTVQSSIEISKMNSKEYELLVPTTEIAKGKVIVKYKDTQGNEIEQNTVLVGNIGDTYETQRKEISSYKPYGYDPINKIGNFDSQDTEVTYVYEKENDNVNIINENNVITVQVIKGQDEKYDEIGFSIITKSATGDIIKGAKYMVTDVNSAVIRNATSYSDKLIVGSLILAEEGTDSYFIKELSAPTGYEPIKDTVKLDVIKKLNTDTNKYEVSLSFEDYENVEIVMENGEIIVVISNEKSKEPVKPENPSKEEKFDLEIQKYITEVKVNTGDKVITKTKDKNDSEIMKIDIPKHKVEKTKIEVTYGIEVKNVGEIDGYAREIVDLMPEGMEMISSSNWVITDNQAKTETLADTLIRPGESVVMYVTFSWNLSNENVGMKTNKAVITEYYNEFDLKDVTPDNYSEEQLLVTTKTGEFWTWAPQALGVLVLGVCVVLILKKFNNKDK